MEFSNVQIALFVVAALSFVLLIVYEILYSYFGFKVNARIGLLTSIIVTISIFLNVLMFFLKS